MVQLTEQILRDGQQSLLSSRIGIEDMLPILATMDKIGFYSIEVSAGNIFESCMKNLGEDPWERLRVIREKVEKTPLSSITRGQSLYGLSIFPDDIVDVFTKFAVKNGISIFSPFDSLNDVRNFQVPIECAKRYGAKIETSLLFDINPFATTEYYVEKCKELERMGADLISIHDSPGTMLPSQAYELIKALDGVIKVPMVLHCHDTTGMAAMCYYEACKAGVDILDTVISPLSRGVSLPPTESIVLALRRTSYDTHYDLGLLNQCQKHFQKVRDKYSQYYWGRLLEIDTGAVMHQLPGGMMSFLLAELKRQNVLDKLDEVLQEVRRVRADFGYPPLAAPISQLVAAQATFNVIAGTRYKIVSKEVKDFVKGLYGQPPGKISEDVKEKILGKDWKSLIETRRPGELLPKQFNKIKDEAEELGIVSKPEDVVTYALYPGLGKEFLQRKKQNKAPTVL